MTKWRAFAGGFASSASGTCADAAATVAVSHTDPSQHNAIRTAPVDRTAPSTKEKDVVEIAGPAAGTGRRLVDSKGAGLTLRLSAPPPSQFGSGADGHG